MILFSGDINHLSNSIFDHFTILRTQKTKKMRKKFAQQNKMITFAVVMINDK